LRARTKFFQKLSGSVPAAGHAGPVASSRAQRPDIQGLRALAVLAVVANHVWGWPRGGFLGVDVFFVVSGFLITGLLLRERDREGRISLVRFYQRRARRILPVAVLVIAVTVAATFALFNPARGRTVAVDGLWSLLFASNWHFALVGTDYWQLDATSPLQHYWSLAVEEQFYLAWPLLLLALVGVARRRPHRLVGAVAGVAALSFGYSLWHTAAAPAWAYFSTLDRAWELAVGALVAVLIPAATRTPDRSRAVLGWLGLLGIVAGFWVVAPNTAVPAPWSALPVAGTALVLWAGVAGPQPWLVPLVNPVAGYVGDLSYSVYLWHFPLVVCATAFFPDRGPEYVVWVLGLTAALSVASYHFLEDPVRSRRRVRLSRRPALGVLTALTLTLGAVTVVHTAAADPAAEPAALRDAPTQRDRQIAAAVVATEFPDLDPGLDEIGVQNWKDDLVDLVGCYDVSPSNLDTCVRGDPDAERSAVVMGDSVAMSYLPGVIAALGPRGYRVQQLTKGQCPAWDVAVDLNEGPAYTTCDTFHRWAGTVVEQQRPDLVVLVTAYLTVGRLSSGASGERAAEEVEEGLARQIRRLQRSARRVVVLEPAPQATSGLRECVTRVGRPSDCTVRIGAEFARVEAAESRAAARTGATFVRTRSWYCDAKGRCPGFVGRTPVRIDKTHLSIPYAEGLAPLLREALLG
jgi:peptidoglycan/LPS O-acetylase OafA/YrhL